MLKPWLELARVSNLPTVWTNVTAAWVIAGGALRERQLLWLLLGGSLLYTAGMILNDAADLAFDRKHKSDRPIPSGRVSPAAAWGAGIAMMAGGAALMTMAGGAAWSWVMGLVAAILIYDLYHKPWPGSVWIMGACRSLLVLAVASAQAGAGALDDRSLLLAHAISLGLYIAGLSLVARAEATGANRTLGAVLGKACLFSPLPVAVVSIMAGGSRAAALGVIVAAFACLSWHALRAMRQGGPHIGRAVGILLAGIPVVDALFIVDREPWLALGFVASFPLLRLWQRKIAAT